MKKNIPTIITFFLLGISSLYIIASVLSSGYGSKELEEAKDNNDIVLVDFWADGCKPCKMIAPYIEEIKKEYPNVTTMDIDINSEEDLHEVYNIRFVPTVIIFYKGEEFARLVGYHDKQEYVDYIELILHPESNMMMKLELE